jgi:hypothetical protein
VNGFEFLIAFWIAYVLFSSFETEVCSFFEKEDTWITTCTSCLRSVSVLKDKRLWMTGGPARQETWYIWLTGLLRTKLRICLDRFWSLLVSIGLYGYAFPRSTLCNISPFCLWLSGGLLYFWMGRRDSLHCHRRTLFSFFLSGILALISCLLTNPVQFAVSFVSIEVAQTWTVALPFGVLCLFRNSRSP